MDILVSLDRGETKPTRIMSDTNMSWTQLHREFERLQTLDLIESMDTPSNKIGSYKDKRSKMRYELTPKGRSVLHYFRKDASELEKLFNLVHIKASI